MKRLLTRLREQIAGVVGTAGEATIERDTVVRTATAALLVEVVRADFETSAAELEHLRELLQRHFGLPGTAAQELIEEAVAASDRSVSHFEFTRSLNELLQPAEKLAVIGLMWRVSLADRRLDKYEDAMIGKLADLLYVSRSEVLRLKARSLAENG